MEFSFDAHKEYSDQTFKRINYTGKTVANRSFEHCTFTGCNFSESLWNTCKFQECSFRECDLRLVQLRGSTFTNTKFEQSKLTGINWTLTAWPKAGLFNPVNFSECDISFAVFTGLTMKKIQIVRCVAKSADFAEANLTQADCTYTDFADSRFLRTDLTEVDFTNATNYSIAASMNTLKKTKFSLPDAIGLLYGLDIIIVNPEAR